MAAIYRCCQSQFVSLGENMLDGHNKSYPSAPAMEGPNILPLLLPDTQEVIRETKEDARETTPQENSTSVAKRT